MYSSRDSDWPGIGYPSCSRALARVSRNYNDSNRYYADLDLPPWASDDEIKSALRAAFKKYHPDGSDPDPEKFLRYREIAEVLTSPEWKQRYDNTPVGDVFVDSEIRERLADVGIPLETVLVPFEEDQDGSEGFYDYFSLGKEPFDCLLAQDWYDCLVEVAPLVRYTASIKVLLHDGDPDWLPRARILMVPRSWKPNSACAFALFMVKVAIH